MSDIIPVEIINDAEKEDFLHNYIVYHGTKGLALQIGDVNPILRDAILKRIVDKEHKKEVMNYLATQLTYYDLYSKKPLPEQLSSEYITKFHHFTLVVRLKIWSMVCTNYEHVSRICIESPDFEPLRRKISFAEFESLPEKECTIKSSMIFHNPFLWKPSCVPFVIPEPDIKPVSDDHTKIYLSLIASVSCGLALWLYFRRA